MSFLIADLVSRFRSYGGVLILGEQVLTQIPDYWYSNSCTTIAMRIVSGKDANRVFQSMTLDRRQMRYALRLERGQAIVKSVRARDLHVIACTPPDDTPLLPQDSATMEARVARLHAPTIPRKTLQSPENAIPVLPRGADRRLLDEIMADPLRASTDLYAAAELGNRKGVAAKDSLVARGLISALPANAGRKGRRSLLLIPRVTTYHALDEKLPNGKGSVCHRLYQQRIAELGRASQFVARLEAPIGTSGASTDVELRRDNVSIAAEVCVSSTAATESGNIAKSLDAGYTRVILCFLLRERLDATRNLAIARYDPATLRRVTFCTVGEIDAIVRAL